MLQLASGRLLAVSHHGAYVHDFVTYSDTDGRTWKTIPQTFPKMDEVFAALLILQLIITLHTSSLTCVLEAQMTQLPNGSVLLNMRHQVSEAPCVPLSCGRWRVPGVTGVS